MLSHWDKHTGSVLCPKFFKPHVIQDCGCVFQEAPTLYLVTCSTKLQKPNISGVVVDSLLHISTVPCFKEGSKKVDGSHTEWMALQGSTRCEKKTNLTASSKHSLFFAFSMKWKSVSVVAWFGLALFSFLLQMLSQRPECYFQLRSPNTINRIADRRTPQVSVVLYLLVTSGAQGQRRLQNS